MRYVPPEFKELRSLLQQRQKNGVEEPLSFEEVLWKAAEVLRGSMDVTDYKHVIIGLFFLKYLTDALNEYCKVLRGRVAADLTAGTRADEPSDLREQCAARGVFWVPPEARWGYLRERAMLPEFGGLIDNAMSLIELNNPSLRGVLPKVYERLGLDPQSFFELVDLINGIGPGVVGRDQQDTYGPTYEYLLSQFASAEGKRGGEFYTPSSVVRLLVEMIEPYSGRVYDPCCGSGGMFVQAERSIKNRGGRGDEIEIYGQEVNATTWQLAKMNLAIHGVEANLGPRGGDSFHENLHPGLKADYIIANPPFNIRHWAEDKMLGDPRWRYGVPPAGNANFAWLQHVVSCLSPRGTAGVVLPNGSVSSEQSGEAQIRQRMIGADLIDCIVALPEQLFYSTQVSATLWFLSRDKSSGASGNRRDRRNETLFIDASKLGVMASRSSRELTGGDITRITDTYHAWRSEPGGGDYVDVPGFCASVTTERIAEHRYVLAPSRYVGVKGESLGNIHARHELCVRVSLPISRAQFSGVARRAPSFLTVIPAGQDIATWSAVRYGQMGLQPEITAAPDDAAWWPTDPLLGQHENKISQTLDALRWRASRLVNFIKKADYLRSQKSPERPDKIAEYSDQDRLVLPIEPHFDAAYGAVREVIIANRCFLISLLPEINGSFLAAWLNSDQGRECRAAAMPAPGKSPRTMSSGSLLRFLDGLIVPVPDLDVQAFIADTAVVLQQAQQRVTQLATELWQVSPAVADIQSAARHWLDSALPVVGEGPDDVDSLSAAADRSPADRPAIRPEV